MIKSIIYSMITGEITKITSEDPNMITLESHEDFDSYKTWMSFPDSAQKVKDFEANL